MSMTNTRQGYGWVAIALHWAAAISILVLYLNGEGIEDAVGRDAHIAAVMGEFQRGDLVDVVDGGGRRIARGLSQYAAAEVRRLRGRHSRDIEVLLGYSHGAEVIHRDDLARLPDSCMTDPA